MMTLKAFTVEYTDVLSNCVTDLLYEQYSAGQHVDVILRTQNDSVVIHGFLLAAQSDLLKRFTTQSGDHDVIIDLTMICDSIVHLRSVVDYMYKRTINLHMTNIKAILKLSQYCSLQRLSAHCKQFLLNRIQPYNCLEIWRIARSFHLPDIEVMALSLIREVFWEVCIKDPTRKDIGTKELAFLMDKISVPKKPVVALEFMIYWLSRNFAKRLSVVSDYVKKLVSIQSIPNILSRLGSFLSQDEQYRTLFNLLQTISANAPNKLSNYYNSPFTHDENWVLVLSEKNFVSLYFPTENEWTTLKYKDESNEVIGILGQTVLSWNDTNQRIGAFNLETSNVREFPPCTQMQDAFFRKYFCTNTGLHTVRCSWYACGFKMIIWRYENAWEKTKEMILSYPFQTAYARVEPCPTDSNMAYILLTSRKDDEMLSSEQHGSVLLRYDSLHTRIDYVFTSDTWAPSVDGRLLCIGDTINFLEDSCSQQLIKSLAQGKLNLKSILARNKVKVVNIPIAVSSRKRPDNITVLADMADNMGHFDNDQFTCYGDKLFWLEQVSPAVVSISIYSFIVGDGSWVEIPPTPLMGLSHVTIKILNRNSILRGGFYVDNEKQLTSKDSFPLVNLAVGGWKDEMLT